MQFSGSLAIFAILPALVAAAEPTNYPNTTIVCSNDARNSCPESADGKRRCLVIGNNLCATTCQDGPKCPEGCKTQGFVYGYCTNGDYECICSNYDASVSPN
ncbi:hypothetical protein MCOR25_010307 [Pyricularia grisea]|uniref:Uncharacterized protein n=1 Tax=Pyricularia grisea TaxID=148305 RepID=A0A6P8B0Q7_PYRGI|nr:uncharacterized protein PgNI_07442 [Pyricularia grisea]KAI6350887.1 hypothetical protein MCOR25_010307 [Pyricularia grisea]TLD08411.1 hypothetical protein PgNI_07442 [Pyricularia grisea]